MGVIIIMSFISSITVVILLLLQRDGMTEEERKDLYKRAIDTWGEEAQKFMVMEETGEMLNALAKTRRNRSTAQEVITELVDVWILMEQMAIIYGYDEFVEEKERKLKKLLDKLNNVTEK